MDVFFYFKKLLPVVWHKDLNHFKNQSKRLNIVLHLPSTLLHASLQPNALQSSESNHQINWLHLFTAGTRLMLQRGWTYMDSPILKMSQWRHLSTVKCFYYLPKMIWSMFFKWQTSFTENNFYCVSQRNIFNIFQFFGATRISGRPYFRSRCLSFFVVAWLCLSVDKNGEFI